MSKTKCDANKVVDKAVDFGRQLFAAVLRSRTGALTELARLLRFQRGTKGFEREYDRLLPLRTALREAFKQCVLTCFPETGLRLGIIDDTDIEKTGKQFPKQRIQHDHESGGFFSGIKVLLSGIYQNGKFAAVNSHLVGKGESKLDLAKEEIDLLTRDYLIDLFLFDSWYCKSPLIEHLLKKNKMFISRLRCDTKTTFTDEEARLDLLAMSIPHQEYKQVIIHGRSFWIIDLTLELNAYGTSRVIISKEGVHDKPIFLITNAYQFSAKFIVTLYLKRFTIEVFFKDAKQYLNFETFFCRKDAKWELHLLLLSVLHWALQTRHSISRTVRKIRENIDHCKQYINQNQHINKFFDELHSRCRT